MAGTSELSGIVADVVNYFQTKPPSDKTIDLWNKKLEGLNLRAAHQRIVEIITNGEAPPKNFPAAVKGAYSSWMRDQPRDYQSRGCAHCLDGTIHAKKEGNVYAFRCGHCNTSSAPYPARTRYQLAQQGYTLDWQHDFKGPLDRETAKKIKVLASEKELERLKRTESEPEHIPF